MTCSPTRFTILRRSEREGFPHLPQNRAAAARTAPQPAQTCLPARPLAGSGWFLTLAQQPVEDMGAPQSGC
jgi:hypothetical protein